MTPCFQHETYRPYCGDCRAMNLPNPKRRKHPRTEAGQLRANQERDADSLAILINRRLYRDDVRQGDHGTIGAVVNELAPGWSYVDASRLGEPSARVELSTYDPDSPL